MNRNMKFNSSRFVEYTSIRNDGLFAIVGAKLINDSEAADRCDFNNWGPIAPRNNEDDLNKSLGTVLFSSLDEIDKFEILYALPPHGYIIYLKLKDDETNKKIKSQELPFAANSFAELIRLMVEWSVVAKEPFNNTDKCGEISTALLDDMNMSNELVNHILDTYPPMQISKYLMGDENARLQNENTFDIDTMLKEWFLAEAVQPDYVEIDGEVISLDDPRIAYSELLQEAQEQD
jgi:hypothetical protein